MTKPVSKGQPTRKIRKSCMAKTFPVLAEFHHNGGETHVLSLVLGLWDHTFIAKALTLISSMKSQLALESTDPNDLKAVLC